MIKVEADAAPPQPRGIQSVSAQSPLWMGECARLQAEGAPFLVTDVRTAEQIQFISKFAAEHKAQMIPRKGGFLLIPAARPPAPKPPAEAPAVAAPQRSGALRDAISASEADWREECERRCGAGGPFTLTHVATTEDIAFVRSLVWKHRLEVRGGAEGFVLTPRPAVAE